MSAADERKRSQEVHDERSTAFIYGLRGRWETRSTPTRAEDEALAKPALSRMQPWRPSGGIASSLMADIDTAGDRRQIGITSPHGCRCPAPLCQDGSAQCSWSLETQVTLVDGEPMVPGEERLASCWDRVLEVEEISCHLLGVLGGRDLPLALGGRGQEKRPRARTRRGPMRNWDAATAFSVTVARATMASGDLVLSFERPLGWFLGGSSTAET